MAPFFGVMGIWWAAGHCVAAAGGHIPGCPLTHSGMGFEKLGILVPGYHTHYGPVVQKERVASMTVIKPCLIASVTLALLSGCEQPPDPMLGTVEWDRIQVLAEASEPITAIAVGEGEPVARGDVILQQDARRLQAGLDEAKAVLAQQTARLKELRQGPRQEEIETARANLAGAVSQAHKAELDLQRGEALFRRGTVTKAELDAEQNAVETARASVAAYRAQLDELLRGTREEEIQQAEAMVDSANARVRQLSISLERLDVRAPRAGRVDSIPHKLGDQPRSGDVLVTLLTGDAPYVRIFVPESRRPSIHAGDRMQVSIDGVAADFEGTVRRIRSDPAFTPYYALSGDDASRLVYLAEVELQGQEAKQLPAGLPARVWARGREAGDGQ